MGGPNKSGHDGRDSAERPHKPAYNQGGKAKPAKWRRSGPALRLAGMNALATTLTKVSGGQVRGSVEGGVAC
jgi:hypothetical protein